MDRRGKSTDRLIDALGAGAAGTGTAVSARLVAIDLGAPSLVWGAIGGIVGVLIGMVGMRAVSPERKKALRPLRVEALAFNEPPEELLLEEVVEIPAALSLEDAVVEPDSRVVQLFAPDAVPTPGQLRAQIDRHLATGDVGDWERTATPGDDASAALNAALLDIRRTLRRH